MKTIVTHDGSFHADDVFATATLMLAFASEIAFMRTRDIAHIESADFVVDVGSSYDEMKERYDHHQVGFKEKRSNNVPYASFGLVWKKYGLVLCGNQNVVDDIDRELVQPIDAEDNSLDLTKKSRLGVYPFSISGVVHLFNSTWKEKERSQDEAFLEAVEWAKKIICRMLVRSRDKFEAAQFVRDAYEKAPDKRLIVLDEHYPAREILAGFPEPLYVIRPNNSDETWHIETIRDNIHSFRNRMDMPKNWGGKKGSELQRLSGVEDAIFCHRNLFFAVTKSKEGAIKFAEKAIAFSTAN